MSPPGPMNPLERSDVDLIVAALNHYKRHVRATDDHPSYEFREMVLVPGCSYGCQAVCWVSQFW